jgi:hypothetical protein
MKQETKIQFLPNEIDLLCDAGILLTKNAILYKIKELLLSVESKQKAMLKRYPGVLPPEVEMISSKISRGENYQGLPWLVLDHPRFFQQHQIFAIRTLFWWGRFFSCTLHLSGKYKECLQNKIFEKRNLLIQHKFYVCINSQEWEHHFDADNYVMVEDLDSSNLHALFHEKSFLKLAVRFPPNQITIMEDLLSKSYEEILQLLS